MMMMTTMMIMMIQSAMASVFLCGFLVLLPGIVAQSNEVSKILVRRCCSDGEILNPNGTCTPGHLQNNTSQPIVVSKDLKNLLPWDTVSQRWDLFVEKPPCPSDLQEYINFPNVLLVEDGSLWMRDEHISDGSRYCVSENSALVCLPPSNIDVPAAQREKKVVIQKCCYYGDVTMNSVPKCISSANLVEDNSVEGFLGDAVAMAAFNVNSVVFNFGFPNCESGLIEIGHLGEDGTILQKDGSLSLTHSRVILPTATYCLEHDIDPEPSRTPIIFTCPDHLPEPVNSTDYEYDIRLTIYPYMLLISAFFLGVTLLANLLLNSHHFLQWQCQNWYIGCLMLGDLLLGITQLRGHNYGPTLCPIVASVMHFLFLAAFFWLNTMCFNIWTTFRDLRPTTLDRRQESVKLIIYHCYCWGSAITLAGLAVIVDQLKSPDIPNFLRPKFGDVSCWFAGYIETIPYFFTPMTILLAINFTFFAMTTRSLTCGIWKREVLKNSPNDKSTIGKVCWKLLVVMGISWLADILSFFCGGPNYVWYVTDIINCLQGIFIFIVVGLQPQVINSVRRIWSKTSAGSHTGQGQPLSTSQDVPSLNDSSVVNTNATSVSCKSPDETVC